jgi:hypothetical protein
LGWPKGWCIRYCIRFAELKARCFEDDDKIEKYRPMLAGTSMTSHIREQAGLVSGSNVMKSINRMVKRNGSVPW